MRTWLKNATLIDGTGAPARDGSVVIEGETLVHVGPLSVGDAPSGADTQVVDLAGRTVIPGLVEAHIHLSYNNVKVIADLDLNCPPEYSTLVSAKNAELALHCGYTAVQWSRGGPPRERGPAPRAARPLRPAARAGRPGGRGQAADGERPARRKSHG